MMDRITREAMHGAIAELREHANRLEEIVAGATEEQLSGDWATLWAISGRALLATHASQGIDRAATRGYKATARYRASEERSWRALRVDTTSTIQVEERDAAPRYRVTADGESMGEYYEECDAHTAYEYHVRQALEQEERTYTAGVASASGATINIARGMSAHEARQFALNHNGAAFLLLRGEDARGREYTTYYAIRGCDFQRITRQQFYAAQAQPTGTSVSM